MNFLKDKKIMISLLVVVLAIASFYYLNSLNPKDSEAVVGVENESKCPPGSMEGGFFDGSEFHVSCKKLPIDYGKACLKKTDCEAECLVTVEELKSSGCYEEGMMQDWASCPDAVGECSQTSPLSGYLLNNGRFYQIIHF